MTCFIFVLSNVFTSNSRVNQLNLITIKWKK